MSLFDLEPWENPHEDYPAPVTALEARVAALEERLAALEGRPDRAPESA